MYCESKANGQHSTRGEGGVRKGRGAGKEGWGWDEGETCVGNKGEGKGGC